jgi:NAD-dependent deacetylase
MYSEDHALTASVFELIRSIPPYGNIMVLTGAGVSQESGVATFRDSNGLWENHRIEDVATPEAYQRNPQLVQDFYNARRRQVLTVPPNKAHQALVQLEQKWKGEVLLITQNVDDLHDRAGSKNLIHMHGELLKVECTQCHHIWSHTTDVTLEEGCTVCSSKGTVRPHIVWFGEMPLEMDRIERGLNGCDLFIAIGTSGEVYPAAGFMQIARMAGAKTLELNLQSTGRSNHFHQSVYGLAGTVVPDVVNALLQHTGSDLS